MAGAGVIAAASLPGVQSTFLSKAWDTWTHVEPSVLKVGLQSVFRSEGVILATARCR